MKKFINNGQATTIWNGISAERLLRRCKQGTSEEARAMSFVAGLMHAAEPIEEEEFQAARAALVAVEKRLIAEFTGEVKRNRYGQPFSGTHPALL